MTPSPLNVNEVSEVGRFLRDGFENEGSSLAFTDEVMRWKYLAPIQGEPPQPRSFLMRDADEIVGHIGLNHRHFVVNGKHGTNVPTVHPMDWIASKNHPAAGIALMLKCFELTPTQYAMGGTEVAQKMQSALRFEAVADVKMLCKVLRPGYRFRERSHTAGKRLLRFCYDYARLAAGLLRGPRTRLEAIRVQQFGPEVEQILTAAEYQVCFSTRSFGLLNHLLDYPGNTFTGWLLRDGPDLVGFALLNLLSSAIAEGRIVECFLQRSDARLWRGAVLALVRELHQQGADYVTCLASTPWMEDALFANGFAGRNKKQLRIRDPQRALPAGIAFHATHLEADLGYL
jgi:hypothetical protein